MMASAPIVMPTPAATIDEALLPIGDPRLRWIGLPRASERAGTAVRASVAAITTRVVNRFGRMNGTSKPQVDALSGAFLVGSRERAADGQLQGGYPLRS